MQIEKPQRKKAATAAPIPELPFYIPATGPASRPRRTLKHDDCFIVVDAHGDIGASAGGPDGFFCLDTRFLSFFELLINGMQPLLLGSNLRDDNSVLTVDLTNPDIFFDRNIVLQKDTLHIARTVFVWRNTAYQRFALQNHGDRKISLPLSFTFGSDFADIFEVRGMRRRSRGKASTEVIEPQQVIITYTGLDEVARRATLHFEPPPTKLATGTALYHLDLAPGEAMTLFVSVQCNPISPVPTPFLVGNRKAHRELVASVAGSATIETSNALFNEILCRSMADMAILSTTTPHGQYPYAGIPWYSTTFGRDGLITAMQMLWVDPRLARGVLRRLAFYQAISVDPAADAEPGKILHEMRAGEMANLGEVPFKCYYGSVDSTPLFVLLAGLYVERTNDEATLREIWPAIEAALAWLDGPADPDEDGLVEYHRATENGLQNQGWKDSHDAIFHADGSMAEGPIALVEVQGYVYAAKHLMARCAARLGKPDLAAKLRSQADALAARIEESFWCPDIGMYAIALDGAKQPCRVRSSNAGQLLFTGAIRPERAARMGRLLTQRQFFSGWGIRTIASTEQRYNPMSYHNGSIWPHDNALIAAGLSRYDIKDAVEQIFNGLYDAASYMELRRLPELFCGFARTRGRGPTLYPVACAPQAWAAGTPFMLLQSMLGLELDPRTGELQLRNPRLPPFLNEVIIRDLTIGGTRVDFMVRRVGTDVSIQLLKSRGNVEVKIVLSETDR